MTAEQFVIWLKGVVTGSHDYAPTPKVWDTIKEELEKVSGESPSITFTSSLNIDTTRIVWNDQMGAWHYANYPEGFGFYTNSTADQKKEQQQLND